MGRLNRKKLFTAMMIFAAFMLTFLSLSSCRVIIGSGNIISETRDVSDFDSISVSNSINLIIEQTGRETVRIEAEDNVVPLVKTNVRNGRLNIDISPVSLRSTKPINCYVTIIDINSLSANNSARFTCVDLKADELEINMGNSARGILNIYADEISVDMSNSAHLTISGEVKKQEVDITNSGGYYAEKLESLECVVTADNSASATVNVSEQLDATARSSGQVSYIGDPDIDSKVSGSGVIINISE